MREPMQQAHARAVLYLTAACSGRQHGKTSCSVDIMCAYLNILKLGRVPAHENSRQAAWIRT